MRVLTVIPARAGSKGLPGKNILKLVDKPLIAWSIEQGLNSRYVNDVVVSTDSEEIAAVAKQYGARVPFLRPKHLSGDTSSTADALIHTIETLGEQGEQYDYIMLLEPTSPLRETADIDQAFERLIANPVAKSIVGISQVESQHPSFCVSLTEDGFIRSKNNFAVLRRQDIETLYFYEGSLYISDMETYLIKRNFYHEATLGYIVPKWKSFEIDDKVDMIIASALITNRHLL